MSTRTNVIIVSPEMKLKQFYRHHDGYFESTGTDLIKKLSESLADKYRSKLIAYGNYTDVKKKIEDSIKAINSNPHLPEFAKLPFSFPKTFHDWFITNMSEDYRLVGDEKSWNEGHYEPEEPFCLHGDIEWIYFIVFNSEKEAYLKYLHLGIGNSVLDKYFEDFVSMNKYVSMNGHIPAKFVVTPS